ncbi:UNVERIFIED_CONTAM: hypothetical protein K2H54_074723 [Gekko kuhli]
MPFFNFLTEEGFEKDTEEIRNMFQEKKVDLSKPLIASCRKGVTACHIALAAYLCGKPDVPVYDGSWSEWFPRGFLKMARQYLYKHKETRDLLQCQQELEEVSSSLQCEREQKMVQPLPQYLQELEEVSPVLRYLQHPEEFTAYYQQLSQPEEKDDTSVQLSEEISPVLQYLQQMSEIGSNFIQRDSYLMSPYLGNANEVENVTQVKICGTSEAISRFSGELQR